MRKTLIIAVLAITAMLLAGAQQGFAYQNVTSSPDGGCLNCHPTAAGTGLHTISAHNTCSNCHPGGTPGKNVTSSKCIVCHPRGNPGKCNLANTASHPKTGAQSCVSCHCSAATTTVPASTTTTTANGATTTTSTPAETTTTTVPAEECNLNILPGSYGVATAALMPIQFFIITAPLSSDVSFADPICIYWGSDGIDDIIKLRLGEKIIFGFIQVWAGHLTAGDFKVQVTYGDVSETRCGPITVR